MSSPCISCAITPGLLDRQGVVDRVAVVIDVLRASTTIIQALNSEAACVIPVISVDGARLIAHDREGSILCGERGGVKPEGFVLGNSPQEYTRRVVQAKDCVLTTTNGTRALHSCIDASAVLIAGINNLDAVCREIESLDRDTVLVCSGTDGRVSLEDCLCAGLMIDRLGGYTSDDSARLVHTSTRDLLLEHGGIEGAIGSSFHAQRLRSLGFESDIEIASRNSCTDLVPSFDPGCGEIRALGEGVGERC